MTDEVKEAGAQMQSRAIKGACQVAEEHNKRIKAFSSAFPAGPQMICEPGQCTRANRLREVLMDAAAHLVGAASAYRTFAKRHVSQGRAKTDTLYGTRVKDFDKAVERVRAALKEDQ